MARYFQPGNVPDDDLASTATRLNLIFTRLTAALGWTRYRDSRTSAVATKAIDADDILRMDTTAAGRTVTLPSAKTVLGRAFTVKLVAGANAVTVAASGTDTVDGAATKVWSSLNDAYTFTAVTTGANTFRWDVTEAFSAAGGGVTDGDKGDIVVSGGGATWTIDVNVVTNANFRQSAGLSLVGRSANTTGNVADITSANDYDVAQRVGTTLTLAPFRIENRATDPGAPAIGSTWLRIDL